MSNYPIPESESAFEEMYKAHYRAMHAYAFSLLQTEEDAAEIVQHIFLKLWDKKGALIIQSSLKAYLYRMVHNDCMNFINHEKVKSRFQKEKIYTMQPQNESANKKILLGQLEERLSQALKELPEQCRTIFQLSRFEDLKYREIAQQLGIAEKTVENQMGKALKLMRTKLSDFLIWMIIFFIYLIR